MKGILLHGGHGTRLRPLTHTGPKQLLPIANKPMSEYCIESMKDAGVTEIAIIIGGIGAQKVKEYYGDGKKYGMKFVYVEQDYPKGIAHAIKLCQDFIANDKFLVFLGDNIIQKSIKEFAIDFQESDAAAKILLCEVDNPSRFGIADIKNNKILKILEKPKDPPTNLAVTGIYFLTPKIFDVIDHLKPSWRNELEITDALDDLLQQKNDITFDIITDYWKDTGTPEDIINANNEILSQMKPLFLGEKANDVKIDGRIIVYSGTKIEKNVKLIGPIIIGKNCIIGEHTELGPNISIGDNCSIVNSKISNSIIMADCKISDCDNIIDSIVAYNSHIEKSKNKNKVFLLGEGTKISI